MLTLRRIVFYLFAVIYLCVCPVTILYALGYVVAPGAVHSMQKTGLIALATAPPGATVYVGGRRHSDTTPTVIRGLLPGAYELRLMLTDHRSWERMVPVRVEKATVLEKIVLLPGEPRPQEMAQGSFTELVPVPGTRFLLLMAGRSLERVMVYDRDTGDSWPLIPSASSFAGGQIARHVTLKESPFVVCQATFPAGSKWLGIELGKGRARLTDLTGLFAGSPQQVTWDPRAAHQIFALRDDGVDRLETDGMALYPQIAARVRGLGVHDGALYLVREDGLLQRTDADGTHAEHLAMDPALQRMLAAARGPLQVTELPSHLLVILSADGELLLNRLPYRMGSAVRGFELDADRNRLLFWRKDRIGILDLSEPTLHVRWALQDGHDIAQVFWAYDSSHLLIRDGATVSLLEAETYGPPAPAEVARVRDGAAVAYVDGTGRLYYLDAAAGHLQMLEIIPAKESRFMHR